MKERNIKPFLGGVEMSMSCEFNLKILTKKVLLSFAIDISAIEYS